MPTTPQQIDEVNDFKPEGAHFDNWNKLILKQQLD